MAKKEDRKKQKKRLREKKKDARRRQHQASLTPALYPDIVVNADCDDPVFRKVVGETLERFSYADDTHCPPEYRDHYLAVATIGWKAWYTLMREKAHKEHSDRFAAARALQNATLPFMLHFGTWLFQNLPPKYTERFDPERFFRIDQVANVLVVSFTLMESVQDKGQRLYIPPWEPTIQMQGVDWKVGLYPHALNRLCFRLVPQGALTYPNCVDVFYRFSQNMVHFDPVTLADGHQAARVTFSPPLGTVFYEPYARWVRGVLGLPETHDFAADGFWSIVLGYLPLHIQGKYARAKTFLLPGFAKTPENGLIRKTRLSLEDRAMLMAMSDEKLRTNDLAGDTLAAIKWCHDNGVPQVFRPNSDEVGPAPAADV